MSPKEQILSATDVSGLNEIALLLRSYPHIRRDIHLNELNLVASWAIMASLLQTGNATALPELVGSISELLDPLIVDEIHDWSSRL